MQKIAQSGHTAREDLLTLAFYVVAFLLPDYSITSDAKYTYDVSEYFLVTNALLLRYVIYL